MILEKRSLEEQELFFSAHAPCRATQHFETLSGSYYIVSLGQESTVFTKIKVPIESPLSAETLELLQVKAHHFRLLESTFPITIFDMQSRAR